ADRPVDAVLGVAYPADDVRAPAFVTGRAVGALDPETLAVQLGEVVLRGAHCAAPYP
ncbi:MAG: hypothetical protein QOF29_3983, partial [bacterium]